MRIGNWREEVSTWFRIAWQDSDSASVEQVVGQSV